jgi:hypothetical protein
VGNLLIAGGSITASGSGGAGIGGGYIEDSSAVSSIATICISGGSFNVRANGTAAAIGSGGGNATDHFMDVRNLTITNGTFRLCSDTGAGVGGSGSFGGVSNLNVLGGSFLIVNGSVGVGAANFLSLPSLKLGSPHIDCRSIGTKACLRASSVVLDNGSLTAVTRAVNLIEFQSVSFSGSPSMYTVYAGVSIQEKFTGHPTIHIELVRFPCNLSYEVKVNGADVSNANFWRVLPFNSRTDRGFGISVPSIGNYRITYNSTDRSSHGSVIRGDSQTFIVSANHDSFYTNVETTDDTLRCKPIPTASFTPGVIPRYRQRKILRYSVYLVLPWV